jgi:hypothetical protein
MTDANPLTMLPPKARQVAYVCYGFLVIATGATQVGYASIPGVQQPVWLTVIIAVVTFLGVPISALAAVNVTPADPAP